MKKLNLTCLKKPEVWSNLAYAIAAFFIEPIEVRVALLILTLGSAGYHITLDEDWRKMDHFGMYAVAFSLVGYLIGLSSWITIVLMFCAFPLVLILDLDESMAALFGIAIGLSRSWVALAVLMVSVVINRYSFRKGIHSHAFSLPHAVWHILTALAIALISRGV